MRHEEENHWHPSDRRHHADRRREAPRYREQENFNDFGSRWGEPDPRLNPRHQDWRREETNERRRPEDDWRPFEQQIQEQHRRQQGPNDWQQEHQQYGEPAWRQRDRHFNSSNQHANDRWQYDDSMPHPEHNERRRREDEHRRDRYRDNRNNRY